MIKNQFTIAGTTITPIEKNDRIFISSLDIAKVFGKRHDKVIRDIEEFINSEKQYLINKTDNEIGKPKVGLATKGNTSKIQMVEYRDNQDKLRKSYILDRDIFYIIVLSYKGRKTKTEDTRKKYIDFKYAFIELFNSYEKAFHQQYSRLERVNLLQSSTIEELTEEITKTTKTVKTLTHAQHLKMIQNVKNVENGKNINQIDRQLLLTADKNGFASPRQIRHLVTDIINEIIELACSNAKYGCDDDFLLNDDSFLNHLEDLWLITRIPKPFCRGVNIIRHNEKNINGKIRSNGCIIDVIKTVDIVVMNFVESEIKYINEDFYYEFIEGYYSFYQPKN